MADLASTKDSTQNPQEVVGESKPPVPSNPIKIILKFFLVIVLIGTLATFLVYLVVNSKKVGENIPAAKKVSQAFKIEKFKNDEDFRTYTTESSRSFGGLFGGAFFGTELLQLELPTAREGAPAVDMGTPISKQAERVSETNVQVAGIDEPDMVKTDGKTIFYSAQTYPFRLSPVIDTEVGISPPYFSSGTKIIKAFPPTELAKESSIDKQGELLLS